MFFVIPAEGINDVLKELEKNKHLFLTSMPFSGVD
jgi:hypothetical protein